MVQYSMNLEGMAYEVHGLVYRCTHQMSFMHLVKKINQRSFTKQTCRRTTIINILPYNNKLCLSFRQRALVIYCLRDSYSIVQLFVPNAYSFYHSSFRCCKNPWDIRLSNLPYLSKLPIRMERE